MGSSRSKETTTQTSTPTATPEERELNELEIFRQRVLQPKLIETQQGGLELVNQLLRGREPLPGFFQELAGGISPEVTDEIAQKAVKDLQPSFQASGILDSGVAASISGQVAGDIRRATQEFNLGGKFNLLNLALSGQAQVQQPILNSASNLGNRLSSLRPVTSFGESITRTPFQGDLIKGVGAGIGTFAAAKCWVASEIFGDWYHPKTVQARFFMNGDAPQWLQTVYAKYGKRVAGLVSRRPLLKIALRPIFEVFAMMGRRGMAHG